MASGPVRSFSSDDQSVEEMARDMTNDLDKNMMQGKAAMSLGVEKQQLTFLCFSRAQDLKRSKRYCVCAQTRRRPDLRWK